MSAREQGLRILEDVADLLRVRDENAQLLEKVHQLETALEVAGREADHYRAECTAANLRCDHLTQQNLEYRIQLETVAKDAEDELEALKARRSKMAARARQSIVDAEMKPYEDARPLARLEVN